MRATSLKRMQIDDLLQHRGAKPRLLINAKQFAYQQFRRHCTCSHLFEMIRTQEERTMAKVAVKKKAVARKAKSSARKSTARKTAGRKPARAVRKTRKTARRGR
jgi:hypothetical protein